MNLDRVTITGADDSVSPAELVDISAEFPFVEWDGVNDHLTYAALGYSLKISALFDTSGGAGVLPASWPKPTSKFWCGYAGGLGPLNVVEQIERIEGICEQPYWIDMERRVRSENDSKLDLQAVRLVLQAAKPYIWDSPF